MCCIRISALCIEWRNCLISTAIIKLKGLLIIYRHKMLSNMEPIFSVLAGESSSKKAKKEADIKDDNTDESKAAYYTLFVLFVLLALFGFFNTVLA